MELDNFYLERYDSSNIDHKTVIIELWNNSDSKKYLGDLDYASKMIEVRRENNKLNFSFIAYYNEKAIGYISLQTNKDNLSHQISYGIVPKYRHQYLGALLLQEFSEKLFELYPEIEELTLIINNLNIGSKKTARLAGYIQQNQVKHTQKRN